MPGLRKYVQDHPIQDSGQAPCDGIAELWFDSAEALQAGLSGPEGQATAADAPNFLDGSEPGGLLLVEEVQLV